MLVRRRTPSIFAALLLLALFCAFLILPPYSSEADARMTPPVLYTPDGQGDDDPYAAPPTDDPKFEGSQGGGSPSRLREAMVERDRPGSVQRQRSSMQVQVLVSWFRVAWLGK